MTLKKLKNRFQGSHLLNGASVLKFLKQEAGGIAIYAALAMPVFGAMAGVGLDMSVWYALKRDVQGMSDAAAIAAAHSILSGEVTS